MSGAFENKGAMAATIVVAASDSLNKAAANYVCDGVADNVEIQAAIDALPAGGGKVVLLEGTFKVIAKISIIDDYVEVAGQGKSTLLQVQEGQDTADEVIKIVGDHCAVKKLRIVGGRRLPTASGSTGVHFYGCSHGLAEDVMISTCGPANFSAYLAPETIFLNCKSYDAGGEYSSGLGFNVSDGSNDCQLVNCYADGTGAFTGVPIHKWGFRTFNNGDGDVYRVKYVNCHAENCAGGGFNNDNVYYPLFVNCIANNNGASGFIGGTAVRALYVNCIANNNTSEGFRILQVESVLENCQSYSNDEAGFHVRLAQRLVNCSAWDNGAAILPTEPYGFTLTNVVGTEMINCKAFDTRAPGSKTQTYGIYIGGACSDNLIVGGTVVGNATSGLRVSGTNNRYFRILGYVSDNSGRATVLSGNTSIVVAHGLAATPTRIQITPRENPTNAVSFWWVDTVGAANFTINVNADPGASNLDFDWHAQVGEG